MALVIACPARNVLHQFMLGHLTDRETESLAQHLDECSACLAVVKTLRAEDTLVEAARAGSTVVDARQKELVRGLVERLRRQGPPAAAAPGAGTVNTSDTHASASSAPSAVRRGSPDPALATTQEWHLFLSAPQQPDEIGRLGPYRILKILGSGGMGIVFQAEDVGLKRQVALKVMQPELARKPEARERFVREARAAAAIEHENIVTIFQVGDERGVPYLAMQLLKGMSLKDRLDRSPLARSPLAPREESRPPVVSPSPVVSRSPDTSAASAVNLSRSERTTLSVPQILRLGRHIARGLAAAHERGLVHRDIKPANLWLEPEHGGRLKILDFGLARAIADDVHLTQSGAIVGTPAYMAPEQAAGEKVDHRCDLFSLGAVLYRLCTGQQPFPGESTLAILHALATHTPRPVRELNPAVPSALADLIAQLLAKNPAARPASAKEVADRLQAIDSSQRSAVSDQQSVTQTPPVAKLVAPVATLMSASPQQREARTSGNPPREADSSRSEASTTASQTLPLAKATVAPAPTPPPSPRAPRSALRAPRLLAAALLLAASLVYFFGGTIIRFAANKGVLIVEVDDDNVEVAVKQGNVEVHDKSTQRRFELTAQGGEIEVWDKGGNLKLLTRDFKLTRGGKAYVAVRLEDLAEARRVALAPDRRAAEWVLSIGGVVWVRVQDKVQPIEAAKDLPAAPFLLQAVMIDRNEKVTDAELVNLKALRNLHTLSFQDSPVADAGLVHLSTLQSLEQLNLHGIRVTDSGLVHIKALPKLIGLSLNYTKVSDSGLIHLEALRNLSSLQLLGTRVSGDGLVHLKGLKKLTHLSLHGPQLSNIGLTHLKGLPNLTSLHCGSPFGDSELKKVVAALPNLTSLSVGKEVTDAGLVNLKDLPNLAYLDLSWTQVGDAGLVHLKGLPNLVQLSAAKTNVSDTSLLHLKALPNLTRLDLNSTQVSDAGMVHLKGLTNLSYLNLTHTPVSDAGLVHLKGLVNLAYLFLGDTRVSDASVEHLVNLPKLYEVHLERARVSANGLRILRAGLPNATFYWSEPNHIAAEAVLALGGSVHIRPKGKNDDQRVKAAADLPGEYFMVTQVSFAGMKRVSGDLLPKLLPTLGALSDPEFDRFESLDLSGTSVTDTDLAALENLPALRRLALDGAPIHGPGLLKLKALPNLTELRLGCPTMTDTSVRFLADFKQLERLGLAGSGVTDQGLQHLRGLTNLKELDLTGTKVTAEAVAALQKSLPKCRILSGKGGK